MAKAAKLNVKIFSPYQTYFQGEALSVSAKNAAGPFDVLPGHANFFSLIDAGQVVIDAGMQKFDFPLERGLIKASEDQVTIFLNV